MKIALDISTAFFQTEKEEFELSGWYSAYTEDNGRSKAIGYVSEKKLKDWGYDIEEDSDILICQSNDMDWKDTEEKVIRRCTDERQFPTDHCDRYCKEPGRKRDDGKLRDGSSRGRCDYLRNILTCLQCDADIHVGRYPADGAASYDRYNEKCRSVRSISGRSCGR